MCAVKANQCIDLHLSPQEPLVLSAEELALTGRSLGTSELVVTRYNEDVRWLDAFPNISTTLYNRGGSDSLMPLPRSNLKVIAQANSGREDSGMLHYIVANYETLPERVIFLQGWPFIHCQGLVDAIRSALLSEEPLVPIARNFYQYSVDEDRLGYELSAVNMDVAEGKRSFLQTCRTILNAECPRTMWVSEGAQWAVDSRRIRWAPKWTYIRALRLGEGWHNKLRGLVLEAIWSLMWGGPHWEPTRHRSRQYSLLQTRSKPSDALGADISAAVVAVEEAEGSYCLLDDDESLVWSCEDRMAFCELQHVTAGTDQRSFIEDRKSVV